MDVSLLYNCIFSVECPLPSSPNPVLWYEEGLWLGCARLCGLGLFVERGQVIRVSNDIDRDQQAQKVRATVSAPGCWNVTFRFCEHWRKFCMGQSERGQVDNLRRGKVKDSDQSLERG